MRYADVIDQAVMMRTYRERLLRYSIVKDALPIFHAELEKWKDRNFNITACNAIAKAINDANGHVMAYASRAVDYNDQTYYQITLHYTTENHHQKYETFDNRYRNAVTGHHAGFVDFLSKYADVQTWIDDTNALVASLPERHANAVIALAELKKYDDLISN